jgi:cytochrome P450
LLGALLAGTPQPDSAEGRRFLRDSIVTYLGAGHDTTASSLVWTFLLLDRHPDVEAALAAEVSGIAEPTHDALQKAPLLGAVVKEVLRLYPSAWLYTRQATEPDVIGDYDIEKNALILISPYVTHRDPYLWPDPDRFQPQRFLDDDGADERGDGRYLPFGTGARACVGAGLALAEMRVTLWALLRRGRIEAIDRSAQALAPASRVTLRPKVAPRVVLRRRDVPPRGGTP